MHTARETVSLILQMATSSQALTSNLSSGWVKLANSYVFTRYLSPPRRLCFHRRLFVC